MENVQQQLEDKKLHPDTESQAKAKHISNYHPDERQSLHIFADYPEVKKLKVCGNISS